MVESVATNGAVVTPRLLGADAEVRRLLRERLLRGRRVGTIWVVDAIDVHRRHLLDVARGRAWTAHVAFGAVPLLAADPTPDCRTARYLAYGAAFATAMQWISCGMPATDHAGGLAGSRGRNRLGDIKC